LFLPFQRIEVAPATRVPTTLRIQRPPPARTVIVMVAFLLRVKVDAKLSL